MTDSTNLNYVYCISCAPGVGMIVSIPREAEGRGSVTRPRQDPGVQEYYL